LAIVAAACNSDSGDTDASGSASASGDLSGGTLKMAMLADVTAAFDPQKEYYSVTWEYYRCCLLRTLMSYKGVPTAQGGADIFPDLAAADPEVSADGLTWTFTIKPGVMFAPAVPGHRDHGQRLHHRDEAHGQPEGQRRRVLVLLLGDQGLRRLRRRQGGHDRGHDRGR
jgi:hypothetical protein